MSEAATPDATGIPERDLPDGQVKGKKTSEDELPANLTEQEERRAQLTKLARYTIEPGLMRLPVSEVTTADNSDQYVIELEHPFFEEGRLRCYYPIPTDGWTIDKPLPKLLRWYGYNTRNVHVLQQDRVYVDTTPEEPRDWEIVKPPSDWGRTIKRLKKVVKRKIPPLALRILAGLHRRFRWVLPRGSYRSMATLVAIFSLSTLGAYLIGQTPLSTEEIAVAIVLTIVGALAAPLVGIFLIAPPGGED